MKKKHDAFLLTPLDTNALERMGPFPFAAPAPLVHINDSPLNASQCILMPVNTYFWPLNASQCLYSPCLPHTVALRPSRLRFQLPDGFIIPLQPRSV